MNALHQSCAKHDQCFDASDVISLVPGYAQAIDRAGSGIARVPVALLLPRGLSLAAAEFSVIHSGRFFLPIDPTNPTDRIEAILQDSSADIVVVDQSTRHLVNAISSANVVDLSEIQSEDFDRPDPRELDDLISLQPEDLAYMIYTSGSTGKPKGVPVHWSALDNHNQWFVKEFNLTPGDRCSQLMSSGFDVSIQDIFPVLRSGASLFPASKALMTDPFSFFQWVDDQQLTVLSFPTALWHTLVPVLSKQALPKSVRLVLIGGEQVNPELVKQWFASVDSSQVRLVNMYGPTEVTIASTFCELSPQQPSAIGKPIDNIQVHLMDDDGNVVSQPQAVGEMVLSGAGVVSGYWNRPAQTDDAFFHAEDLGGRCYRTGDLARYGEQGELLFVGRKDNQVKLRGFRIELNEIALAVSSHPKILDAVVQKVATDGDREFLACYAIAGDEARVNESGFEKDLRDHLESLLPEWMVPTEFTFVSRFPVTVGGKVDTAKLKSDTEQSISSEQMLIGSTETERRICRVWKEVLGHPPESTDTTFESSAGDSLTAVSFVLRLQQEFDLTGMGLATIATRNTLQSLAAHVDNLVGTNKTSVHEPSITYLEPASGDENLPCLILLHPGGGGGYLYGDLFDQELRDNFSIMIVESPFLTQELPADALTSTFSEIAQQYCSAALRYLKPDQQIVTAGFSFGGLLAWEFAQLLNREGYQVSKVINIDQPVPAEIKRCGFGKRLSKWLQFRLSCPTTVIQDVRRMRGLKNTSGNEKHASATQLAHLARLEELYFAVEKEYVPQPNNVDLTLIHAEYFFAKFELPEGYGWAKLTDSLRVVKVSGSHSTMFDKRFIDEVRSAFLAALKR